MIEPAYNSFIKFYRWYVHNIFCLFKKWDQTLTFLDFWNIQRSDLNFTIEKEHMKPVPFLDVLNTLSGRLITSVYRKTTFTGPLQNYNSFVPFIYKKGLIETLIDQTFWMYNTWDGFYIDLENLKIILQKWEYPSELIDKSV